MLISREVILTAKLCQPSRAIIITASCIYHKNFVRTILTSDDICITVLTNLFL